MGYFSEKVFDELKDDPGVIELTLQAIETEDTDFEDDCYFQLASEIAKKMFWKTVDLRLVDEIITYHKNRETRRE